MGVLDKLLDVLHLNPDDEEEFYDDDYGYEDDYEEPVKPKSVSRKEKQESRKEESFAAEKPAIHSSSASSKVTPIRSVKKTANDREICVIRPTSMEDCCEITDTLLNNRAVVLNLEGLDIQVAQRIIDYAVGSSYAINGNLKKVSNYIFIITPPSTELSGDFADMSDTFDPKDLSTLMDI